MKRVEGKVAIVTGGAGGIGFRSAARLAAEGASVVLADIAEQAGERCAEEIRRAGGSAVFQPLDVRDPAAFDALVAAALARFGRLDVMHNNAAGTNLYAGDGGVADMGVDHWDLVMDTNLRSVMLGCRAVLPAMIEQGSGSIINMSSTRALAGALDLSAYATSKAALLALTRQVATGYGKDGVRCNAVLPGLIVTDQSRDLHGEGIARLLDHVLLPHAGTPDDIAHLIVYLASDESRFVTAQELRVDGGLLSHQPFLADSRAAARGAG